MEAAVTAANAQLASVKVQAEQVESNTQKAEGTGPLQQLLAAAAGAARAADTAVAIEIKIQRLSQRIQAEAGAGSAVAAAEAIASSAADAFNPKGRAAAEAAAKKAHRIARRARERAGLVHLAEVQSPRKTIATWPDISITLMAVTFALFLLANSSCRGARASQTQKPFLLA